ncbi:Gfo/Idh/MocA family protein [Paenibacillus montanisoli]|uniref:Gfo/Idh/MocA family oxidoreductase n=1 Tax=Paenibacillus montanisoli TaxID=2081970 RepID=A0A328U9W6_9BACL|nr:Gfo/Idh/MocA family oxidoreductase [Paenibacillus montanisoli]RAP77715.1 gfo/Idh/MocA family oxidoreductase [Paenibacillus montanisoli]
MAVQNKLKVGVLGCGVISQAAHLEACVRANHAELHAICDVARDLVEKMSGKYNPNRAYYDYDAMLADPDVEAVVIGIADQFHVPMAKKALLAGKHVLVEKPLGVTIEECEELEDIVRSTNLILQVGNMKRFDPGIAYARNFIQQEMGEMLALKAWYCDSTYRYVVTENVMPVMVTSEAAKKPEGNPKQDKQRYYMMTHGSHLVDTARFLGGEIESVHAWHSERFGAHNWLCTIEFANGTVGQLDLTVAVRMDWHEGFQVYGEHGSVIAKTYNPWLFKASEVEVFSAKDGLYRKPLGADAHFYKLQLDGFADTILNGSPMMGAGVHDGVQNMRAMVALARSAEMGGGKVKLSDVSGAV